MSYAASTSANNPLKGAYDTFNTLISPRRGAQAPTILSNITGIAAKTASLVTHTLATAIDVPLGVTEASIAGVNNVVGLITTGIDKAIVTPIDDTRKGMFKLLSNPLAYVSP